MKKTLNTKKTYFSKKVPQWPKNKASETHSLKKESAFNNDHARKSHSDHKNKTSETHSL